MPRGDPCDASFEGENKSNLKVALEKFDEAGYRVLHRKVWPGQAGIPMNRNRLHFQAIKKGFSPEEETYLRDLGETWDRLSDANYPQLPLEAFLFPEGSVDLRRYLENHAGDFVRAGGKENRKQEWKVLHARIFEKHQASNPNCCVLY